MNSHVETEHLSLFNRLKKAVGGIIFGLLLVIGAMVLIWWNEGRSVDRIKILKEGLNAVIPVAATQIDPSNSGQLIHLSGFVDTAEQLADPYFGLNEKALKLKRVVEMYQWKEEEKTETTTNTGGSQTKKTTYSYNKTWSEELINSSSFRRPEGHQNPQEMPYRSQEQTANTITLGAFTLSSPFTEKISNYEDYMLTSANVAAMPDQFKAIFKPSGNYLYYGDASNPKIGTTRISYKIITPQDMSVVGQQTSGGMLSTYNAKHGTIKLLKPGTLSAEEMFAAARSENALMTWGIRGGGVFMMWIGFLLITQPLRVLSDIVPFFGRIVGMGLGLITGILAVSISFVVMAVAWIFYRPLLGLSLLAVAVLVLFGGFKRLKGDKGPDPLAQVEESPKPAE